MKENIIYLAIFDIITIIISLRILKIVDIFNTSTSLSISFEGRVFLLASLTSFLIQFISFVIYIIYQNYKNEKENREKEDWHKELMNRHFY